MWRRGARGHGGKEIISFKNLKLETYLQIRNPKVQFQIPPCNRVFQMCFLPYIYFNICIIKKIINKINIKIKGEKENEYHDQKINDGLQHLNVLDVLFLFLFNKLGRKYGKEEKREKWERRMG